MAIKQYSTVLKLSSCVENTLCFYLIFPNSYWQFIWQFCQFLSIKCQKKKASLKREIVTMAFTKTDKKINKDIMTADEMWKVHIRSEDDSGKVWKYNWGWILEEYECLKKKMDEKTASSELLKRVTKKCEDDDRKLGNFPESFNHWYGWIAEKKEFQLEKYGPDFFKPIPIPEIYNIPKH